MVVLVFCPFVSGARLGGGVVAVHVVGWRVWPLVFELNTRVWKCSGVSMTNDCPAWALHSHWLLVVQSCDR